MNLPPLPFGDGVATLKMDVDGASALMAGIVPSMVVQLAGNERQIKTRLVTTCLGDMRLKAGAARPRRMTVGEVEGFHLVMPCVSLCSAMLDRERSASSPVAAIIRLDWTLCVTWSLP